MGIATDKQILFAYSIAEKLNLEKPRRTFEDCFKFIKEHKDQYYDTVYKTPFVKSLYDNESGQYKDFKSDFNELAIKWIEDNLHKTYGLYCFLGNNDEILYIGKSIDLASRIPTSYCERKKQANIVKVMYYITPSKADASILEMLLITENKPFLNYDGITDDNSKLFKSNINIIKDFKNIPFMEDIQNG